MEYLNMHNRLQHKIIIKIILFVNTLSPSINQYSFTALTFMVIMDLKKEWQMNAKVTSTFCNFKGCECCANFVIFAESKISFKFANICKKKEFK